MKNILFIILLIFGLYKVWKYLAIRHFESTKYIKRMEEIKCEALPPTKSSTLGEAKHNDKYSHPDPWNY